VTTIACGSPDTSFAYSGDARGSSRVVASGVYCARNHVIVGSSRK